MNACGWKLLNLDEPLSLKLTDIPSQAPRPDYRRGAKHFVGISQPALKSAA